MSALGSVTQAAAGASSFILIGLAQQQRPAPTSIGLCAALSANGNLTYSIQVTCDPIPSDSGNWVNHDVLQGLTVGRYGNIAYAVTAVRLFVSNYVAGSVNLGVAQWP